MKLSNYGFLTAGLILAAAAIGCGDDETASTDNAGGAGGGTTSTANGGSSTTSSAGGAGGAGGGSAATANVRVAHLSPGAPDVDFCIDSGDGFIGPVLEAANDTDGLAYGEVTAYLPLPAGTYDIRIVAATATDCTTAVFDKTGVVVPGNIDATVAALGEIAGTGATAFDLGVFVDDNTPPTAGNAKLRFIHASPGTPNVDVGTGSEASADFSAVWSDVTFGTVGSVGGGDYLETPPLSGATVSARATGTTADALVIDNVALPADTIATAFAVGNPFGANDEPLKVLLCIDSGTGGDCSLVPTN